MHPIYSIYKNFRCLINHYCDAFPSVQYYSLVFPPQFRQLGLKPKRTLRLVLWTDEEAGGVGSQQYYQAHKDEAANFSVLFESDEGVFTPYGIRFTGSDSAREASRSFF